MKVSDLQTLSKAAGLKFQAAMKAYGAANARRQKLLDEAESLRAAPSGLEAIAPESLTAQDFIAAEAAHALRIRKATQMVAQAMAMDGEVSQLKGQVRKALAKQDVIDRLLSQAEQSSRSV